MTFPFAASHRVAQGSLIGSREWRTVHGRRLTLLLVAASIVIGTTLAITCSYRPIALWWVMVACSAVNLVRFGARSATRPARERAKALRAASALGRRFAVLRTADAGAGAASTSKASLDRQNSRFLIWFTQHNLLWTILGFGGSLLIWHRFGPAIPALVVMSALMACGLFAAFGTVAGARTHGLGLCWREPCRTPAYRNLHGLVDDVGTVVVLRNRHEFAAARDWSRGGRFHELFLTIDELARAGVEPGLAATLHDDGDAARRALGNKERCDRALALAPVFVASLLAALLVVPPLAGNEPLPPLWDIVTGANGSGSSSDDAAARPDDGTPRASSSKSKKDNEASQEGPADPSGRQTTAPTSASSRAAGDGSSNASPSSSGTATTAPAGTESETGDRSAGNASGAAGSGAADGQGEGDLAAGRGSGAGSENGGRPGAGTPGNEGESGGPGGRGGGPKGYGTEGDAPQRAESPAALPNTPQNPGKAIEVVLPPFAEAKDQGAGDDPTGEKRKGTPPPGATAYQPVRDGAQGKNESTSREPVQRWPNWVFRLLHKKN